MFQEALSFALEFIGTRRESEGCTSIELSEFLLHDVAPFCGQAPNTTFRDAVALLLIADPGRLFTVFQLPPVKSGGRGAPSRRQAEEKELPLDEVGRLLEEGAVQWDAAPAAAAVGGAGQPVLLSFRPTQALRERVLGFPLASGSSFARTADFMCDMALTGWVHVKAPSDPALRKEFKAHLLTARLRDLRKRQLVAPVYLREGEPKFRIVCLYFPRFAVPLSEVEKAECRSSSTVGSAGLDGDPGKSCTTSRVDGDHTVTAAGLTPAEFRSHREKRGNRPLEHYFARRRAQDPTFPPVVFDLGVIKYVVTSSPDRRLLLQDAIHAIMTAHGVFHTPQVRGNVAMITRVLTAAGLRTVNASVALGQRRRTIRLVMSVEDLLHRINQRRARERRRLRGTRDAPSDEEGELDGHPAGTLTGPGTADGEEDEEVLEYDETTAGDDDGGEDENDEEGGTTAPPEAGMASDWTLGTAKGKRAAFAPMYHTPDLPMELQACEEAERRPLAVQAIYPKALLGFAESGRKIGMGPRLAAFMARYGTIEEHQVVEKGNRSFTYVYTPVAGARTRTSDPPADGEGAASAAAGTETARKASTLAPGVSRYAVETVMTALRSSPRGACTMARLSSLMDFKALTARIVPYLRSAGLAVSTGVSPAGKRRLGIVALAGVNLSEDDKLEMVREDEAWKKGLRNKDLSAGPTGELVRHVTNTRPADTRPLESDILLTDLPAIAEGAQGSALRRSLFKATARTSRTIAKILLVRNGYAKHSLFRAGRLHLELWRQWHERAAACTGADGQRPEDSPMPLREVYENMSLSTFCITVGFSALDLTTVLGEPTAAVPTQAPRGSGSKRQTRLSDYFGSGAARTREGDGPTAATLSGAPTGLVSWATPLRDLPPSVRELCDRQGEESLRHALQVLQERRLIQCPTTIDPFISDPLLDLAVTLVSVVGGSEDHHYILCDTTGATAPSTPSSTAYAVLRYWLPLWADVSPDKDPLADRGSISDVDDNLTIPKLVAVSRALRVSVTLVAHTLYQDGEWARHPRRRLLAGSRKSVARTSSRRAPPLVRVVHRRRTAVLPVADGSAEGAGPPMTAGAVEAALMAPLSRDNPRRRLEEVLHAIDRVRRRHWGSRPLSKPTDLRRLPARFVPQQRTPTWLMGKDPRAWIGLGSRPYVGDRTALWVLGGAAVSPESPRVVVHAGVLACTAKQALLTAQSRGSWLAGGERGGSDAAGERGGTSPHSSAQPLAAMMQSIFNPDATAVRTRDGQRVSAAVARLAAMCTPEGPGKRGRSPASGERWVDDQIEIALDALRMILFSDMAHYDGASAKELLYAFRPGVVLRARGVLQRAGSFRAGSTPSTQRGRIPQLALIARPYVLPGGSLRHTPRRCANAALLHAWAASADAAVTACSRGRLGCESVLPSLSPLSTASPFDLSLRRQPVMDVEALVADVAQGKAEDASAGGSGAEAAARRRAEATLRALRLPALAWPAQAATLEAAQVASEARAQLARARAARRRRWEEAGEGVEDRSEVLKDGGGGPDEDAAADAEDDEEEEELTPGTLPGGASSPSVVDTTRSLYPSRLLAAELHQDDAATLEGIAVAGPATDADRERVQRAIARIRGSTERQCSLRAYEEMVGVGPAGGSADGAGRASILSGLAYPSVFHHVDGTFNEYVWRLLLLLVYQLVLRVAGARGSELHALLTESGLFSHRAVEAALEFLCASGVLTRAHGPERTPGAVGACPFAPPPSAGALSYSVDAVQVTMDGESDSDEVYYSVTVHPSGLWDIMRL